MSPCCLSLTSPRLCIPHNPTNKMVEKGLESHSPNPMTWLSIDMVGIFENWIIIIWVHLHVFRFLKYITSYFVVSHRSVHWVYTLHRWHLSLYMGGSQWVWQGGNKKWGLVDKWTTGASPFRPQSGRTSWFLQWKFHWKVVQHASGKSDVHEHEAVQWSHVV